jgi:hypothetical protein
MVMSLDQRYGTQGTTCSINFSSRFTQQVVRFGSLPASFSQLATSASTLGIEPGYWTPKVVACCWVIPTSG